MKDELTIHLDFSKCNAALELHQRIKSAFKFPDWYGCNWDVFYDLLCTDVEESRVIITGLYSLPSELQDAIPPMLKVLEDIQQYRLEYGESFVFEIIN